MANVTKRQAEAFLKAFIELNVTPDDIENNVAMPKLDRGFDDLAWSIYWDWANFYGDEGYNRTVIPPSHVLWSECVNSQRIALYPL